MLVQGVADGFDVGAKQDHETRKQLDELSPGLSDKILAASKAEMVATVRGRVAGLQAKMTEIYAANFTNDELRQLLTFFQSPTGAFFIRKLVTSTEGPEIGEELEITAADMIAVNKAAVSATFKEMTREQKLELFRFGLTPAGRGLRTAGPKIQAASAEWMTSLLKDFEARSTPVIERIVTEELEKAGK